MWERTAWRGFVVLIVATAAAAAYGVATRPRTVPLVLAAAAAVLLSAPVACMLALRWINPRTSTMMYVTGRSLAQRRHGDSTVAFDWIDLDRISPAMSLAAIAGEDAFFRHHSGFDWESIRAAHAHNRTHEYKRGGSTITQQLAKNLFLWPKRSYVRKALEAYLTILMEAVLPKRRILELYLNVAQFGEDVFGVQAAARRYFAKPAADLSRQEGALLIAALQDPARYVVVRPGHRLRVRQFLVLESMKRLNDDYLECL